MRADLVVIDAYTTFSKSYSIENIFSIEYDFEK
jgi:hypothetical protein